ncbi:hypothetical protein GGI12_000503 [Dipsacomyces acuminosporus]|nr:hypothetical protein GGI12_000503 [Dipsacomyces acuminosporus]
MSRLDAITGRMSKLMLQRWSMLAEICPKDRCSTPLMRDPLGGEAKCVWHDAKELFPDEDFDEEPDSADQAKDDPMLDEKIEPEESETPVDGALDGGQALDDEKRKALQQRREQGDEASQRIAKRLLQGWKMIDRVCPNDSCYSVPLVEDREQMQLCVICEQRYMDEEAYTKKYGSQKSAPTASRPRQAADSAEPPKTAPESSKAGDGTTADSQKGKEERGDSRSDGSVVKRHKPSGPPSSTSAVCDTLQSKIADLATLLQTTTSLKEIVHISNAIKACAKALRECKKLDS